MRLVRQILKALAYRPWYTASIVVVMAVGCALLTSVLAIVDGVLFKPLGYPGERQLVAIAVASSRSRLRAEVDVQHIVAWGRATLGVEFTAFRQHSMNCRSTNSS